jgi:UDP-glucose 4-epimerase
MKFKKVIVTGGAGFIGSHLVDSLVDISKKVIVIDRRKPRKLNKNVQATYKKMEVQSEEAFELIKKEKPDVVFHLAAHINDRESTHEPVMNADNNIIGTLNMLQATRSCNGTRFVFASTSAVYGSKDEYPISEDVKFEAHTPYGISKLTAEHYLRFYNKVCGISYIALRFANVFGPRQDSSAESGAIGIFSANLLKGDQVYINNDGQTKRDYIYVKDVVRALTSAAESDFVGVLNVGTGQETTTEDLFEMVRDEVGSQAQPEYREEIEDLVKRSALDASEAKKILNWKPEVSLQEGIEETVDWYRKYE